MSISDKAIQKLKGNNRAIARLMIEFDRGQATIENWMNAKDVRLTTPSAVTIISTETGLAQDEVLEPVSATVEQN